ncbi:MULTISPECIES: DUF1673 family protein [unclassified Methanoculleus]|uniref:DUF1673 family protein n=2 Tax=Methanoculleus TaxID=45989 RepID=UPI0025CDA0BD|nr:MULTISPECIES: DUF1673 family protein [unclassified Methanoculleus]MCK9318512.1 DUF1673 domain-containing protein [Methanoculleus sp.]MDD2253578.1 DUF1673 family protein [Methanoculleus sp.]MDD2787138.1 DUF1673 family protein [Methanoculleus sp.]MDD4314560.1 DUF1673 family protein [Methanoculleus sp.]MDD4470460.1 DUF1673 family protein [Methanoculleus sp.]
MMVFVEYIRKRLGWCPNAAAAGVCQRRYAEPAGEVGLGAAADGNREVVENVFVDYVSPRLLPLMLLALGGFFGLLVIGFLIPQLRSGFYILLALTFTTYAAVRLYLDTKQTVVESFGDAIIVRRPHSQPLVFEKDAVRSVEVKETNLPIPRWAVALLFLLLVAGIFFGLAGRGLTQFLGGQMVDPEFSFHLLFSAGFAVYLLAKLYHALLSLRYPGYLKVKLESGGFLHVYTDDPERIARVLGGS